MRIKILFFTSLLLLNITHISASNNDIDETVQSITDQLTKDIKSSDESIAVPPFMTLDNKTTMLGKVLSEKLITEFAKEKKIVPVERDFIFKLTDEMKLGMTGLVEPKTVQQIGKFSGASFVLVGTIQKISKDVRVNSRLVRTETSKVEKSIETKMKASSDILELLSQEINTPHIPITEETEKTKLLRTDFDKLRKDYEQLQNDLEKLKQQMAQAKDVEEKQRLKKKETETVNLLTANEYFAKGEITLRTDLSSAIQNFSKAIELNPNFAEAYYRRGLIYEMRLNDYIRAISDYNKAIEINSENPKYYYSRGWAYYSSSQYSTAKMEFQKACDLGLNDGCIKVKWLDKFR